MSGKNLTMKPSKDNIIDWLGLLKGLPDHIVLLDRDLNICYVNRPSPGLTEEQLIGTPLYTLVEPERQDEVKKILKGVLDSGKEATYETVYKTEDITIYYESRVVAREEEGEIVGLLLDARDITELKETRMALTMGEMENSKLQKQLIHSQKMESMGRLTGGIAHDFNNILASVVGYLELAILLAKQSGDNKQLSYLEEALSSSDRATKLVQQMLAFARGSSTEPTLQNLSELINDTVMMLRPVLTANIEIATNLNSDVESLKVDVGQINQVLMNLCINARDAMDGKGNIEIGLDIQKAQGQCDACHEDIDGEWVHLSVKDNGPGIGPEIFKNMFEPFFTSKDIGKGSGMGLSVVHGIVHDHSGHIQVDTSEGKGTTFHILLPILES